MRFITCMVFFWGLCCFPLSNAAEVKKGCLPGGEPVDQFLIRQVGGGYAELTTDTQKKKPLQLLMEEIVLADGRDKAPGKWIDDIPDALPPALPDIKPLLTSPTIYTDAAGANAHRDDFARRHPLTAAYFKEQTVRPRIIRTLSPDIDEWARDLRYCSQYLTPKNYQTRGLYLEALAEVLLYADFVYAHGVPETKAHAVNLLMAAQERLYRAGNDVNFARNIATEFLWPMLNNIPDLFQDKKYFRFEGWKVLYETLGENTKDRLRLEKWLVNHTDVEVGMSQAALAKRANEYVKAKDYTGALICHFADTHPDETDRQRLQLVQSLLIKQFGQQKGAEYYKRFLESLLARTLRRAPIQAELAASQKGTPASKSSVPATKITSSTVGVKK
jgi:hypothetical protein